MFLSYSQYNSDILSTTHKLSLSGYLFGRTAKGLIIGMEYGKSNDVGAVLVSFGISKAYNIIPGRFQLVVTATTLAGGVIRDDTDALTMGGSLEGGIEIKLFQDLWVNASLGTSKYVPASSWRDGIGRDKVDLSQEFIRAGVEIAF